MAKRRSIADGYLDSLFTTRPDSGHLDDPPPPGDAPSLPRPAGRRTPAAARSARRARPRRAPAVTPNTYSDVTITLGGAQTDFLDGIVRTLRAHGDDRTHRDDVAQTILDALDAANLDWTAADSPAVIADIIRTRLAPASLLGLSLAAIDTSVRAMLPLAFAVLRAARRPDRDA